MTSFNLDYTNQPFHRTKVTSGSWTELPVGDGQFRTCSNCVIFVNKREYLIKIKTELFHIDGCEVNSPKIANSPK